MLYLFIAHLTIKVVFELGLGYWHYHLARQEQVIFFSLIVVDYLVSWRQFYRIRFTTNHASLFALFFLFVSAYGLAIGIINGNRWFEILNDTAPLLVMSLNIFRLNSEFDRLSESILRRLVRDISALSVLACAVGALAVSLGKPATYALGAIPLAVYTAAYFAFLLSGRSLTMGINVAFFLVLLFSAQDVNRTTLMLYAVIGVLLSIHVFLKAPPKAVLLVLSFIASATAAWTFLPSDSKTAKRIDAMFEFDISSRKTSVGEREVEFKSIQSRLEREGTTVDVFGLGHGALYEMRGAHKYKRDYGHAHFSWALFKLRYGDLGYVLVVVVACVLLANIALHAVRGRVIDRFIVLLSTVSFLYLFTYVNFIFLLSGLAFLAGHRRGSRRSHPSRSIHPPDRLSAAASPR